MQKTYKTENSRKQDDKIIKVLDSPNQLEKPIKSFKIAEIRLMISKTLNSKKAPGYYDLITEKIIKELPDSGVRYTIQLFNTIIITRLEYFLMQRKVAQSHGIKLELELFSQSRDFTDDGSAVEMLPARSFRIAADSIATVSGH